jgi:single-strand DNA-binding protein
MNKLFIIGNLVRNPELRTTPSGITVCNFTVAVNRRNQGAEAGQTEADFFRVTTWRGLAENCNLYLSKGKKVGVVGTFSVQDYVGNDGRPRYSLEIMADEVEFLSPKGEQADDTYQAPQIDEQSGFVAVDDSDLPF